MILGGGATRPINLLADRTEGLSRAFMSMISGGAGIELTGIPMSIDKNTWSRSRYPTVDCGWIMLGGLMTTELRENLFPDDYFIPQAVAPPNISCATGKIFSGNSGPVISEGNMWGASCTDPLAQLGVNNFAKSFGDTAIFNNTPSACNIASYERGGTTNAGFQLGSPTGGAMGNGTLNLGAAFYENGINGLGIGGLTLQQFSSNEALDVGQLVNGHDAILLQRQTDSGPSGYLIRAINKANNANEFSMDTSGNAVFSGNATANYYTGGATPGISGGGSLSTGSNSFAGRITGLAASSNVLTPGFTCPNAVTAVFEDDTTVGGVKVTAQSTTTVTFSATASDTADYIAGCR